jgi:hypothetical protein
MKKISIGVGILFIFSSLFLAVEGPSDYEKNWPQWRGPLATGVSPNGNPPIEWGEDKNVKWKIAIPGKGHATPIIWGDQMFILSAVETDKEGKTKEKEQGMQKGRRRRGMPTERTTKVHKFVIFAINRHDGKILWQHTVREEVPEEGHHQQGS